MPAVCMMQAAGILLSVLLWHLRQNEARSHGSIAAAVPAATAPPAIVPAPGINFSRHVATVFPIAFVFLDTEYRHFCDLLRLNRRFNSLFGRERNAASFCM